MLARLTTALVLSLAATVPAPAGPIDASSVPDRAAWVVHVDFEALRTSALGQAVVDGLTPESRPGYLEKASEVVGFDLQRNLLNATIYGGDFTRESAAILVDIAGGTGNLEGLMLAAPGYTSSTEGNRTIHSFLAEDKRRGDAPRMFLAIDPSPDAQGESGNHRLVAAYDREVLHAALDRLPETGKASVKTLAAAPAAGSIFYMAIEDIGSAQFESAGRRSAILRMIQGLSMDLGQADGRITAIARASVTDPQKAEQLRQLVEGMLAMAQFGDPAQPTHAAAAALAQAVRASAEGSTVSLRFDAPADDVAARVRQLVENVRAEAP